MFRAKLAGGLGFLVLIVIGAQGAVLLEDHFDSPVSSNLLWNSNNPDKTTLSYQGGVCTINNTDAVYAGIAIHTFEY